MPMCLLRKSLCGTGCWNTLISTIDEKQAFEGRRRVLLSLFLRKKEALSICSTESQQHVAPTPWVAINDSCFLEWVKKMILTCVPWRIPVSFQCFLCVDGQEMHCGPCQQRSRTHRSAVNVPKSLHSLGTSVAKSCRSTLTSKPVFLWLLSIPANGMHCGALFKVHCNRNAINKVVVRRNILTIMFTLADGKLLTAIIS